MHEAQRALVHTMVLASAADADMTDNELRKMGETVRSLPVFRGFEDRRLPEVAGECSALLQGEDGLNAALDSIRQALPDRLRETAYAVACDVIASDGHVNEEEVRMLEILRDRLGIDRLTAAALERGARARHMTL